MQLFDRYKPLSEFAHISRFLWLNHETACSLPQLASKVLVLHLVVRMGTASSAKRDVSLPILALRRFSVEQVEQTGQVGLLKK